MWNVFFRQNGPKYVWRQGSNAPPLRPGKKVEVWTPSLRIRRSLSRWEWAFSFDLFGPTNCRRLRLGLEFFESSAKENVNVTVVFERLVDLICDRMSKSLDTNAAVLNNPQTRRLTSPPADGAASALLSSAKSNCQQCWRLSRSNALSIMCFNNGRLQLAEPKNPREAHWGMGTRRDFSRAKPVHLFSSVFQSWTWVGPSTGRVGSICVGLCGSPWIIQNVTLSVIVKFTQFSELLVLLKLFSV